jgi:two-component system, LytTR family, sensor kinase
MNSLQTIRRYKLHHVLFWLTFFAGWYFLRYQDYSSLGLAAKITAIKVFDLALLVYITNLILIPRLLFKKKYALFVLIYIPMIFVSSLLKITIIGNILIPGGDFSVWDNFKTRFYDNIIPHYLLVSTGAAVKLLVDYARAQRRMGEMAKEKAEAELNFLRSQINPHFVFNTLNAIYFQIDKENKEARETVLQFSDIMRYQLYDCNTDKIDIEKEIAYLEDYVQLQKKRRDENYEVQMDFRGTLKGFKVSPLLLVPLVENAFKHISHHSDQKNLIRIESGRLNGEFIFKVENTKENGHASTEKPSGGIGLNNVKRRLELLYPEKHELNIFNEENWFRAELKLQIENSEL